MLDDLACTPGKYMVLRGTACCLTVSTGPLLGFREERKEGGFDVFWLVLGYGLRLGPRIFINLMCEVRDT